MRSEFTPDIGSAVSGGGVLPDFSPTEGELGLAFLWRGRVLGEELHNVRVVLVAADAAFADDVHDAGEHVARAAAETASSWRPRRFLFLTRVQDLKVTDRTRPQDHDIDCKCFILFCLILLVCVFNGLA